MASPVQTQPMAEAGAKLFFHDGCIGLHPCEVYSNSNTAVGKNLANSLGCFKRNVAFFSIKIFFWKKKTSGAGFFFHQPYVYTYESWVCIVCRFGSTNRTKQLIQMCVSSASLSSSHHPKYPALTQPHWLVLYLYIFVFDVYIQIYCVNSYPLLYSNHRRYWLTHNED